jgi:uncharacterized membrane protein
MWTRSLLKFNAKQVLSRCYWRIFAACLIASLLGGGLGSGVSYNYDFSNWGKNSTSFSQGSGGDSHIADLPAEFWAAFGVVVVLIFLIVLAISLAWQVFLGNPISVGLCRFLMECRVGRSPMDTLFSLFRKGTYGSTIKAMFWYQLKVFLWSLLLIVPGVIKGYEYRFIRFLLAENPQMGTKRAQELSRLMSNGEKGKMFVLDLSFFGWYLLVGVAVWLLTVLSAFTAAFGGGLLSVLLIPLVATFGSLCIAPYYHATIAELYAAMREKIFAMGLSDASELGGFIRY